MSGRQTSGWGLAALVVMVGPALAGCGTGGEAPGFTEWQAEAADAESGAKGGPVDPLTGECAKVHYKWSEFVGSSAEIAPGLPSDLSALDTRAGSVEINTLGGLGFTGESTDPPFHSAIVTLRNGTGARLEQIQINRRWPATVDASGCSVGALTPQCWVWNLTRTVSGFTLPGALVSGTDLLAAVPDLAGDSNDAFDSVSGARVTVSGGLDVDYTQFTGVDNGHQTVFVKWEVPAGRVLRDATDLALRGRYDWAANGLGGDDAFITLFRTDAADPGHNVLLPGVTIVEDVTTRLVVSINVQTALNAVREAYLDRGIALTDKCQPPPVIFKWDEFVAGAAEKWPGLPSAYAALDTRAGSVEYNSNGGYGFTSATDPAFRAATLTLRNGKGAVIEQVQSNRKWPPPLDVNGCNPASSFPQCWDSGANVSAAVPDLVADSNVGFDASGDRVVVEGIQEIYGNLATGFDQYNQRITATFRVPAGRDLLTQTQFKLRGRYDWDCNGLGGTDPMVELFKNDLGTVTSVPGVEVVSQSATHLTLSVNKEIALNAVRDAYVTQGLNFSAACL